MRSGLGAALLLLAIGAATAQVEPRVAWTEPGERPSYGFVRLSETGGTKLIGQPVAWDWSSTSPDGAFAAYIAPSSTTLQVRDLTTGADSPVPTLPLEAARDIADAEWAGQTLWLLVRGWRREDASLWALNPRVPAAVSASGRLSVAQFTPTTDGQCAYVAAREGGPGGTGSLLALCYADGRSPRQIGEREVIVSRSTAEEQDRVAFLSRRSDRAGVILNIFDRVTGQEIKLNPEAHAFDPVFAPGLERAAYTTREGIVVHDAGSDPVVVWRHLPDRRFAKSYRFTPDGESLVIEVPADRDDTEREFVLVPVAAASSARTVLRAPCKPGAPASGLTFAPNGGSVVVTLPRPDPEAPDGLYLVSLTGARPVALGFGGLVLATVSPSGERLAFAMRYKSGMAPDEAGVALVSTAPGAPGPLLSLSVPVRRERGRLVSPSLALSFSADKERLLVQGVRYGTSRPGAFIVDAPGQAARLVSGAAMVREARWDRSGRNVIASAVVRFSSSGAPLVSVLSISADDAEGRPKLVSGQHLVQEVIEAADGTLVAITEAKAATRRLVVARSGGQRAVLSSEYSATDPIWSPDGGRVAFFVPMAPSHGAVYVGAQGEQPIRVSGDALVQPGPRWLSGSLHLLLIAPDTTDPTYERTVGLLASAGGGAPTSLGVLDHPVLLDGQDLLFYARDGDVFVRQLPDGQERLIARGYQGLLPAPDGRATAVFSEVETGLLAGVCQVSGGAVAMLGERPLAWLGWSPDSAALAGIEAETRDLVLFSARGEEIARIAGPIALSAWSPDSKAVAAIAVGGAERSAIACFDATGRELLRSPCPQTLRIPVGTGPIAAQLLPAGLPLIEWTPDGKAVLFVGVSQDGLLEQRTVLMADGTCLPTGFDGSISDYAFGPTGLLAGLSHRLARADEDGEGTARSPTQLAVLDVAEGRARLLSGSRSVDGFQWLPDGRIAFWCSTGASEEAVGTFVTNADGTGTYQLAHRLGAVWPAYPRPTRHSVTYRPPARSGSAR